MVNPGIDEQQNEPAMSKAATAQSPPGLAAFQASCNP